MTQKEYLTNELNNVKDNEVLQAILNNLNLRLEITFFADDTIDITINSKKLCSVIIYSRHYVSLSDVDANSDYQVTCSYITSEIYTVVTSIVNYQTIQNLNLK